MTEVADSKCNCNFVDIEQVVLVRLKIDGITYTECFNAGKIQPLISDKDIPDVPCYSRDTVTKEPTLKCLQAKRQLQQPTAIEHKIDGSIYSNQSRNHAVSFVLS